MKISSSAGCSMIIIIHYAAEATCVLRSFGTEVGVPQTTSLFVRNVVVMVDIDSSPTRTLLEL